MDHAQPYLIMCGMLVSGIALAITQKYKLILIGLLTANLTVTLLCEVSFLIPSNQLYYIAYPM